MIFDHGVPYWAAAKSSWLAYFMSRMRFGQSAAAIHTHTRTHFDYILQEGGRHANECYDLPNRASVSPSREGPTASQHDRCCH